MSSSGAHLSTEAKIEWAAELIRSSPGLTAYQLNTALREHFGMSRRVAQNILARTRSRMAEGNIEKLRDLATELPDLYRDCLQRCRAAGNLSAEVKALRGIAAMTGAVEIAAPPAPTPSAIEFLVVGDTFSPDGA
ncbi:MAG TPA: hypothetical protein PKY77_20075 [Phycisphaerae bacterium]|nr:hypothetical protein [Phycisphaerae bacterium]HRY69228.1 hypothetical protein [Phycisphaerae bacterium]HSA26189.1 hypothetical protein [Phycisphaerae bacterium]